MQLHQQRQAVTEPEARYFMHQLLLGVKYLHKNKMIHRHLRLENLFLNDNMVLKIGDFGWVAKPNLRAKQIRLNFKTILANNLLLTVFLFYSLEHCAARQSIVLLNCSSLKATAFL